MRIFNLKIIIAYGLYLLAFLLPWQTRLILRPGSLNGGYFEYGSLVIYGTDILLILLLFLFLILEIKFFFCHSRAGGNPGDCNLNWIPACAGMTKERYWYLLAGLEFITFVSIFFAEDKLLAAYKYIWILLGIGFLFLLGKAEYKKIYLLYFFLLGVFFQAVFGIWQFLNQFAFASKWLGMAEHDPSTLGVSVIEVIGADGIGERWLRAYGGLDHPNMLGGLLAIGILIMILVLIENKKNIQSRKGLEVPTGLFGDSIINNHSITKYLILASHFLLLTFCTALFFTFSRSAWLACVTGISVLLLGGVLKKDWFFQRELLKIILFSGILVFILFLSFGNLASTRIKAQSRLEQKSNIERIESYKNGYEIIKENFFFGTGIGNYTLALAKKYPDKQAYAYQPVHNVFLLIFAELGIFGFIFFCSILFYIFYTAVKAKAEFSLALFFALIILMMFDHYIWSLHFGVLFFCFIIFLFIIHFVSDNQ